MYRFAVVKLTDKSYQPGTYKVVPSSWITRRRSEIVAVPYPEESEVVPNILKIVSCDPPSSCWREIRGTVEYQTNSYAKGLKFIKRRNTSPNPEDILIYNPDDYIKEGFTVFILIQKALRKCSELFR